MQRIVLEGGYTVVGARIAAAMIALRQEVQVLQPKSLSINEPAQCFATEDLPGKKRAQWKQEHNAHRRAW